MTATPRSSAPPGGPGASESVLAAESARASDAVLASDAAALPAQREPLLVDRIDPDHPTHRERLLEAFAESVRAHGFRGTTVAAVVRGARTSRRTFYEHFADLDACFITLGAELDRVLTQRIVAALDPDSPWQAQVEAALGVYVDECYREPEIVRACERELPGIGDAGLAHQRAALEQFADLIVTLAAALGAQAELAPVSKETAIMVTGGLRELILYGLDHATPPSHVQATAVALVTAVLDPEHRAGR